MKILNEIQLVRARMASVSEQSPLCCKPVALLAASKGQSQARIREAIAAGITHFGENRVSEAQEKWPALRQEFPHIRLHMIGSLQSNKVSAALELFDVIQTLDRPSLAQALSLEIKKTGKKIPCYIQINTGEEAQKSGVTPPDAPSFIHQCQQQWMLPIVGLMCIPPLSQPPAPHFALLREIARQHALPELSMGMSDDYEAALRMGSTCIRLGRVLFGERSLSSGG